MHDASLSRLQSGLVQDALAGLPAEPEGPGEPPSQPYGPPHTNDTVADAAAATAAAADTAARPRPKLLRAFPYFHTVDANKTAKLIHWSHKWVGRRGLRPPSPGGALAHGSPPSFARRGPSQQQCALRSPQARSH